jgi:Holliday junction resolvasome RuvABC endonuclease subunit
VRILGIDPGFANIGVAVLDLDEAAGALTMLHAETVITKRDKDCQDRGQDDQRRCAEIGTRIAEIASRWGVSAAVLEAPSLPRDGRTKYVLGLAYGRMWGVLEGLGIETTGLLPQRIKRALTGDRQAGKGEVEEVVRAHVAGCEHLDGVIKTKRDHPADAAGAVLAWILERQGAAITP